MIAIERPKRPNSVTAKRLKSGRKLYFGTRDAWDGGFPIRARKGVTSQPSQRPKVKFSQISGGFHGTLLGRMGRCRRGADGLGPRR